MRTIQPYGRSLHIGVNQVDPKRYVSFRGRLQGCENDARSMANVARHHGFIPNRVLVGPEATTTAVFKEIAAAASDLPEGSFFLLTFAGHGGQRRSEDRREEKNDQTWCLYDRQLIDDELRLECWPGFRPRTRVLVIVDSCHSGTSISLLKILLASYLLPIFKRGHTPKTPDRALPALVNCLTLLLNRPRYRRVQTTLAARATLKFPGSVLSISACADEERTPDGTPNGKFTATLCKTWDDGRFSGSHDEFFRVLSAAVQQSYGKHPRMCCPNTVDPAFLSAPWLRL